MGVPPVEGIVLLFMTGGRILRQVIDLGVTLVSTATAVQLMVPHAGIEGDIAHALPVDVEIGPDVLVPRAIVTRADAATVGDVTCVNSQVKAVLIHLGRHIQCSLARGRAVTPRPAVTQGNESESGRCGFGRGGEGDLRPRCHVLTVGVYLVIVGRTSRQASDSGRMPIFAVVDTANGSHYIAVALVKAVANLTGPSALCSPGDNRRGSGGLTNVWVDQQTRWGLSCDWCRGRYQNNESHRREPEHHSDLSYWDTTA